LESERKKKGYSFSAIGNFISQDKRFTNKEIKDGVRWMISPLAIKELRSGGKMILSMEKK